jgi:Na+-translocating ferredoxin:NAD+ oxidoreductase RNF subunit RnfB
VGEIATSVTVMTGLSLVFAVVLAAAYRFLRVEEDPRLEVVEELLPGNNCGACGEPGCAAFAQRLVADELAPGKCTVADEGALGELASFLGVDVGGDEKLIARLKCAGGASQAPSLARYRGAAARCWWTAASARAAGAASASPTASARAPSTPSP